MGSMSAVITPHSRSYMRISFGGELFGRVRTCTSTYFQNVTSGRECGVGLKFGIFSSYVVRTFAPHVLSVSTATSRRGPHG